ncbi:unnamed protein product [Miscanthus lutarioriparius]|uniref:R13L1/DRL21-like LRR repeat region domain-containing protein n=1 Tax=Miscanthus lutarioriparius TaxID=422564 RepID=A0A811QKB6_9POAL|nr:unnamed protein product [Miscanthus lutarioriparius]
MVKLPGGIGKLRQLRYLSLLNSGINNIPRGFSGLTNLRVLKGFPAHVEGDWCSLEELGPLNRLTSLDIRGLENVSYSTFAIKVKLGEKVHLIYLCLQCTSGRGGSHRLIKEEEQQQIEKVFDEICPPPCLENPRIKECPELKVLEGLPALQRLDLEDYDMKTLPRYLKDANPRLFDLDCNASLLASIAKGESSSEWNKFSHIKQVNAHADDKENNIERKWYVKYTRDPLSLKTNISPSTNASSGDETEEVLLDEVEETSRDEIQEERVV